MQALVRVQLGDRELLELRHRLAHAGLDLLANASCGMDHLMLMMTDGVVSPIGPVAATSSDAFAESLGDLLAPVRAGGNNILAIISRSKTHITLAFARGAEFEDAHGLLEGVGKTTRHVKLKNPDAVDAAALRDYIRQAVALDKR